MKNLDVEAGGATMRKKPETGPSLRGFLIAFVVVAALVGSIAAVVKQYDEGHGSSRDDALSTYQVASIGAYPGISSMSSSETTTAASPAVDLRMWPVSALTSSRFRAPVFVASKCCTRAYS